MSILILHFGKHAVHVAWATGIVNERTVRNWDEVISDGLLDSKWGPFPNGFCISKCVAHFRMGITPSKSGFGVCGRPSRKTF
jgi:hypothetical protein